MRWIFALLPLLLLACSGPAEDEHGTTTPSSAVDALMDEAPTPLPAPAPGEGIQLKVKGHTINPGDDVTLCTYINGATDVPLAVNGSRALQRHFGHHIVVYQSDEYIPDGVEPCYSTDSGMNGWTLLMGNFKEGYTLQYPEDVAIETDPNKTLIVNSHYTHYGSEPIEVDDAINLYTIPTEDVQHWLGSYFLSNFDIAVPPGGSYQNEASCPVPMDMNILLQIGHTHDFGTNVRISRSGRDGEASTLYEGLPTVDDPTIAGAVTYFDEPLKLQAGERLSWSCEWENPSDQTLGWPEEMCTVLLTYYPEAESSSSLEQIQCLKNLWGLEG